MIFVKRNAMVCKKKTKKAYLIFNLSKIQPLYFDRIDEQGKDG